MFSWALKQIYYRYHECVEYLSVLPIIFCTSLMNMHVFSNKQCVTGWITRVLLSARKNVHRRTRSYGFYTQEKLTKYLFTNRSVVSHEEMRKHFVLNCNMCKIQWNKLLHWILVTLWGKCSLPGKKWGMDSPPYYTPVYKHEWIYISFVCPSRTFLFQQLRHLTETVVMSQLGCSWCQMAAIVHSRQVSG